MTYYAILATVLAGLLLVFLPSTFVYRAKLEDAKKLIEDHREQYKWVTEILKANSRIVAELRKQGFTMGEGADDIDSGRCFLRTKETRPSGLVINVMAAFNQSLGSEYYWVRIFMVFPHQGERAEGIPALKKAIAALVRARFSPLSQEYLIDRIPVDFVNIVGRIDKAVKFYEEAMEKVESGIFNLDNEVGDLKRAEEELVDKRSLLQIRIDGIVDRLAESPSLSEAV